MTIPHNGTETSKAAAESIEPIAPTLRERVFMAIEKAGAHGLTDEEIATETGIAGNTVRPRRQELQRKGRVVAWGATRKTKSGRAAVVWHARAQA